MNDETKIALQAATCHVSMAADQLDNAMKQLEGADSVLFSARIQDIDTLHSAAHALAMAMMGEAE